MVIVGGLHTRSWHCQGLSVLYEVRGADVLAMAGEAAKIILADSKLKVNNEPLSFHLYDIHLTDFLY